MYPGTFLHWDGKLCVWYSGASCRPMLSSTKRLSVYTRIYTRDFIRGKVVGRTVVQKMTVSQRAERKRGCISRVFEAENSLVCD